MVRYLRKLESLPTDVDVLLKYARSPRLRQRHLAQKNLKLCILNTPPRTIDLLNSYEQWKTLAETILKDHRVDLSLYPNAVPGRRTFASWKKNRECFGPVHCEVAVALHFLRSDPASHDVPALPYIGVSKLSCLACWTFFRCLHDHACNFYIRGTHAKAYFPWKYPDCELNASRLSTEEQSEIWQSFLLRMGKSYAERFRSAQKARSLSDSSANETVDDYLQHKF